MWKVGADNPTKQYKIANPLISRCNLFNTYSYLSSILSCVREYAVNPTVAWGSALFVSTLSAFLSLRVTLDEFGEFMLDTFADDLPELDPKAFFECFNFVRHFWFKCNTNSFGKSFH